MFGLVHCNASILARLNTDAELYFVRSLVKNWLWPIITFFGVTGNILAIVVLSKRRMIMSSTNNYLVALAIVDIAYLILTLILNTAQHPCFISTSLAEILMTICRPIADFSSNTSVWLTVTFTVERWVAITYPLQSRTWCTVSRSRRIILSVMAATLICTLPSAFETKLIRVTEIKQSQNITRIRARATALGESLLYHQIYFNFVTFAIVSIPLVLLIIFNTILIIYVHRSRQDDHRTSHGIKLRRHNRSSQGEQRKTTIMLIAVVIVFTVCQIPQAISLTVQSFFPTLSRTSKVLIYNNFANCLVAVNASINFLLYCCFSDRFRLTFSSSFSFISKYCVQYIEPSWKRSKSKSKSKASPSMDTMSFSLSGRSSSVSVYGRPPNKRLLNIKNDYRPQPTKKIRCDRKLTQSDKWSNRDGELYSGNINFKQTIVSHLIEKNQTVPTTVVLRSSSFHNQPAYFSHSSTHIDTLAVPSSSGSERQILIPSKIQSLSMNNFDHLNFDRDPLDSLSNSSYSQRSLQDDSRSKAEPMIWIRHQRSARSRKKFFNQRGSPIFGDIADATV